ncbi:MAG: lipoate--protein ligase [Eubacteriales bacterium]|nr:lipoate--protein ligase [Eubacteriales bacterium]
MITKTGIFYASGTCPERNLALEEYLLFHTEPGECLLYLWQNERTVVVGRNQNCWKECDVSRLKEEGGHLVRRLSGGGAVYHDLGNLNFTFLVRKEDYDLERQLRVIQEAVESFGIPVKKSGRNDLLAEDRKFSGNAYYESGEFAYHHGTILIDADKEQMARYLTVSKEKLKSKGVDSVRSRVGNLKDLCPEITVERMKMAMEKAFAHVYGVVPERREVNEKDEKKLRDLEEKYNSFDWKYGRRIAFTHCFSRRYSWGSAEFEFFVNQGRIWQAALYSDALDTTLSQIGEKLLGCPYERAAVIQRIQEFQTVTGADIAEDLIKLIQEEL